MPAFMSPRSTLWMNEASAVHLAADEPGPAGGARAISREASPAAPFLPDNDDDDAPATQLDCRERRVGGRPDRGQHATDGVGSLPVRGDRDASGLELATDLDGLAVTDPES